MLLSSKLKESITLLSLLLVLLILVTSGKMLTKFFIAHLHLSFLPMILQALFLNLLQHFSMIRFISFILVFSLIILIPLLIYLLFSHLLIFHLLLLSLLMKFLNYSFSFPTQTVTQILFPFHFLNSALQFFFLQLPKSLIYLSPLVSFLINLRAVLFILTLKSLTWTKKISQIIVPFLTYLSCLNSLKELLNFVSLITCLRTVCSILSSLLRSNLILLRLLFYLFMTTSLRL